MKIREILAELNNFAPLSLQENFDNAGLNVGNVEDDIKGVLICMDVVPEVVEEAIENNCNLIISHHPLIFNKLTKISGENYVERALIMAIKNDIAIYCGHTNFDSHKFGVSFKMTEKLGLINTRILDPKPEMMRKMAVFVPTEYADIVRNSMFEAGAGNIGHYDCCSFNVNGSGSFRADAHANPFVGKIGECHFEQETKIEVVYPVFIENKIINAMLTTHPYEEVAYDIFKSETKCDIAGLGMYGELEKECSEIDLLNEIKEKFNLKNIRYSKLLNRKIKKIAVCGGSGALLIKKAKQNDCQVFMTADLKYHDYFQAENNILLIDIGHYESEIFVQEIFFDIIYRKNINFGVRISNINTNPINYF
jgi:dinuclear metal center YbgI/SA1388 family protein